MNEPIKRSEYLKPLSREHHYGLLLCWKIRTGFKKGIAASRIKAYSDWFYQTHLLPHFEAEEKQVFTLLPPDNELVVKAVAEHQRLKSLFESTENVQQNLGSIEKELEQHIRFEERVLFREIQEKVAPEQLQSIVRVHAEEKYRDNLSDAFWE